MPFFVILLLVFFSLPSFGETLKESPLQIWRVGDRRWTVAEEYSFGKWVETNITEDFFFRYKIPIDCADVPYAIRWIYARIANLPAAATTKDDLLIGHWSTAWSHLPVHPIWHKDQRFRTALLHMLTETTTKTIPLDTYPIQVAPESVTPGTVFFVTESHSGVVGRVVLDGSHVHPLQTWESTLPAKIQKINQRNFLLTRPESTTHSGLVKFRWPVFQNGKWQYLSVMEHPFYSLEQYTSGFYEGYTDYVEAVARRIDPTHYDPWEKMEKMVTTITRYLQERIPIVLAGHKRCSRGGCPEGSDLWEVHSTPGRDGWITLMMDHLHQFVESNRLDQGAVSEKLEKIRFRISKDRSVTFYHIYQTHLWFSHEPEDSIEARWGLKKCEMIFSNLWSAKSAISFIESTYRKRDPKYADFSVRQQQEIIRRLIEEWDRSECREKELKGLRKVGKK